MVTGKVAQNWTDVTINDFKGLLFSSTLHKIYESFMKI